MKFLFESRGKSPLERFLRSAGLFVVLILVAWASWKRSERNMEALRAQDAVFDETGAMADQDREFVRGFVNELKDRYGLEARIRMATGPLERPEADPKTLHLLLSPANRQVVAVFPPLMRQALGQDFIRYLEARHFARAETPQDWVRALETALAMIWDRLLRIEAGAGPGPAPDAAEAPEVRGAVTPSGEPATP